MKSKATMISFLISAMLQLPLIEALAVDVYYSDMKCQPSQACSTTSEMCIPGFGTCTRCTGSTQLRACGNSSGGLCASGGNSNCGIEYSGGTCGTLTNTCSGGSVSSLSCQVHNC